MGFLKNLKEISGVPDLRLSDLKSKIGVGGEVETEQSAIQSRQEAPQQENANNNMDLYDPRLEKLIDLALADGELTEKEKQVLFKKAESMGIDLDEFEMVLDARLHQERQATQSSTPVSSAPQ